MLDTPVEWQQIRPVLVRLDTQEASLVGRVHNINSALLSQESNIPLDLKTVALLDQEVEAV